MVCDALTLVVPRKGGKFVQTSRWRFAFRKAKRMRRWRRSYKRIYIFPDSLLRDSGQHLSLDKIDANKKIKNIIPDPLSPNPRVTKLSPNPALRA